MQNKRVWLVLLVLPLLAASLSWAQGIPTGTLKGTVTDEGGAGLPGVSVTITAPTLQGTRTAVTNVNGDYVFPQLPPGDYTVKIALSGFQTVTKTQKISSGQESIVSSKLAMAGVTSAVVVAAQSETVSQTAAATTTYSAETLDKLPVARTILSSVALTPGVNQNGPNAAYTINGATSFENNFTVNGVSIPYSAGESLNTLISNINHSGAGVTLCACCRAGTTSRSNRSWRPRTTATCRISRPPSPRCCAPGTPCRPRTR